MEILEPPRPAVAEQSSTSSFQSLRNSNTPLITRVIMEINVRNLMSTARMSLYRPSSVAMHKVCVRHEFARMSLYKPSSVAMHKVCVRHECVCDRMSLKYMSDIMKRDKVEY